MAKKPCINQPIDLKMSNHVFDLLLNSSYLYLLPFAEDDCICVGRMTGLVCATLS